MVRKLFAAFIPIGLLLLTGTAFAQNLNMARSWTTKKPITNEEDVTSTSRTVQEVALSSKYLDGFGRPVQVVTKQASPLLQDGVQMFVYDAYGRPVQNYLPFISNAAQTGDITNNGNYKSDALQQQTAYYHKIYPDENFFYSQVTPENSPVNRTLNAYAQGNSWVGSSRGSSLQYLVNTGSDNVQEWEIALPAGSLPSTTGSCYPTGQLYKMISTDEKNSQTIDYKDKDGHTVLSKVQLSAEADDGAGSQHAGWLCTYYVYDDYGNMRFVIPAAAVPFVDGGWHLSQSVADELCYRYEYDLQNRIVIKKNPGAGEQWFVYDQRGRLVMTQDANQRAKFKWKYIQYDQLDRVIASGLIKDPAHYNDLVYHQTRAENSSAYPDVASFDNELLTQTYYDNYDWVSTTGTSLGSSLDQSKTGNTNYFYAHDDNNFPYPQAISQTPLMRGLVTGGRTEVLESNGSQYLYSVNFYDNEGRVIQVQSTNINNEIDKVTTQYSWLGLPLRTLEQHRNTGGQTHDVLTKMDYDPAGRLLSIAKKVNSTIGAATIDHPEKTIAVYQYNEAGQLLRKNLGTDASAGGPLEETIYDYNIRGWLTGINKNYTDNSNTSNSFGIELGYDKPGSVNGSTSFAPRYDGNPAGEIWKSRGDGVPRKYDYSYDMLGRLTGAAFLQNAGGGGWKKDYIDYSVNSIGYDLNGNIKNLNQNGFVPGGAPNIDDLTYTYESENASNRLKNVMDGANNPQSKLGDFHYAAAKTSASVDYGYDDNGNMTSDVNKNISSITYNTLNLPLVITIRDKGTITYTYDAAGSKLKKQVDETNAIVRWNGNDYTTNITTITTYISGFVYQSKIYRDPALAGMNKAESLLFFGHEEGRARLITLSSGQPGFAFDYFVRDNLNNVRQTLTDEGQQDVYPAATLENGAVASEQTYYNIVNDNSHIIPVSQLTWYGQVSGGTYPNNNGIPQPPDPTINRGATSARLYKLNAATGDRFGLGIALKVMAGDVIDIFGRSVWHSNGQQLNNGYKLSGLLEPFISAFGGTNAVAAGTKGAVSGATLFDDAAIKSWVGTMLDNVPDPGNQTPKAYINWIFFDDQFKPVETGSSFDGVNTQPDAVKPHIKTGINVQKSGYLYIYCSNESNQDVYFDNIQVAHTHGSLLEERHYYPGGLVMAGISSRSFGKLPGNAGYQGKEMQNGEFYDGSGLEEYDFEARFYDPQLQRWHTQDPVTNYASPYSAMANNPVQYVDPDGQNPLAVAVIIGAIAGAYSGYQIADAKGYNMGDIRTWGFMLGGAAIGAFSGYAGASITAGGGFMSNTLGIMTNSYLNSAGMSALSDGMISPGMSIGGASFDLGTGQAGWLFKPGNSFLENVGYFSGALANIQDAAAGFNGANVEVKSRRMLAGHSQTTGTYTGTDENGCPTVRDITISVGPENQDLGHGKGLSWEWEYVKRSLQGHAVAGENVNYIDNWPNGKPFITRLTNVNGKKLADFTERLDAGHNLRKVAHPLTYGLLKGCVNYNARALFRAGVINVNALLPITAPVLLNAELGLRQAAIFAQPFLIRN